ncbi:MAG: hypothetical protein V7L25_31785 [Nostoc sp.]|uniref:hypothetical protein n=1 Tax=Nostoc sp. TaxID=1180 RepID=UPI002FF2681D
MVIGQGVVRVPADTADIELVFSRGGSNDKLETQPSSLPQTRRISSPTLLLNYKTAAESLPSKKSLTKSTLQPVVNSLVAKGISADKIQV